MPIPEYQQRWRAVAPEDIKAEDLSLRLIVLSQIKIITLISANIFNNDLSPRYGLLNLKNSIGILHETLEGSDTDKKLLGRKYEAALDAKLRLTKQNLEEQNSYFKLCKAWYRELVPKLKVYDLLPMKKINFDFDRGFIDPETGEVLKDDDTREKEQQSIPASH